jgi:hypothetical protein
VLLTMKIAIGQFTPPMAVNLMVACRLAQVRMEQTCRGIGWMMRVVRRRDAARAVHSRTGAVAAAPLGYTPDIRSTKETQHEAPSTC